MRLDVLDFYEVCFAELIQKTILAELNSLFVSI